MEPVEPGLEAMDGLVKRYLDRETERIDASNLLARVQAAIPGAVPAPAVAKSDRPRDGSSWHRRLTWTVLSTAAVVLAFLGGRYFSAGEANAATILRSVQSVHAGDVDRCYRVQYAPDPRTWDRSRILDGPSQSVLWTRGDRFWSDCTIGSIGLQIGRDGDGTLWIANSRTKGIRFADDPAQLPREVALICAANSMTVPMLVDHVLADFDLRAESSSPGAEGHTTVVWASLKPDRSHPLLSAALLEIDTQNNVVNRLVLWMLRDGSPRGTVTYTLLDRMPRSDAQYRLESHLDADAKIDEQAFQATKP